MEEFVYKLKKPVRFDFLDYSTPEARKRACDDEVRLNRRLAPGVYLGVVPVRHEVDGGLCIGPTAGQGVHDWAVRMRRLSDQARMDRLLVSGRFGESQLELLSDRLAEFYRGLNPVALEPDRFRQRLDSHVLGNQKELGRLACAPLTGLTHRVLGSQRRFMRLAPELFDERVRRGRVVEGHGDLRPEHVYFEPAPLIIDCIEFNPEYRQVDVADELAFLAMECEMLGARDVGSRLWLAVAERIQDVVPRGLWSFYKAYRACVRAKVHWLRADQLGPGRETEQLSARRLGEEYLRCADRQVPAFARPFLLVVRGLMGTGKSTLAGALAESLDLDWLRTDVLRRQMVAAETGPAEYGQGRYSTSSRDAVYQEMFRQADLLLQEGASVVLDGTFLKTGLLRQAAELASRHGAVIVVVECICPDDEARDRIAKRLAAGADPSEARPELLELQKREREPLPEGMAQFAYPTGGPSPARPQALFPALRNALCIDETPFPHA